MSKKELLEQQADAIEHTLAQHGAHSRVTTGVFTPRVTTYRVVPTQAGGTNRIRDLIDVLSQKLGKDIALRARGEAFDVEVINSNTSRFTVRELVEKYTGMLPPMTAIFGVATDGLPLMAKMTNTDVVGHIAAPQSFLYTITLSLTLQHSTDELAIPTDLEEIGHLEHARQMPHREVVNGLAQLIKRRADSGTEQPCALAQDKMPYVVAVVGRGMHEAILEHGPAVGVHVIQAHTAPRWAPGLAITDNGGTMAAIDKEEARYTFYPAKVSQPQIESVRFDHDALPGEPGGEIQCPQRF